MDIDTINKIKHDVDEDIIIEDETKRFYYHALILEKFINQKITKEEAFLENAKLVNYPEILKHEYITDLEALIISSLLDFINLEKQDTLLNRLSQLFESEAGIMNTSDNSVIYTLILRRLIKSYGNQRNYTKVISLCDIGIKRGLELKQYYLWDYFYYYKSVAYFKLEDFLKFEENLFKCYSVLHMEGNSRKIERFTLWIENEFNINFDMFILKFMQKKVK